jgi:transcriptional regulator with GAF, ATPase, and Fis domain
MALLRAGHLHGPVLFAKDVLADRTRVTAQTDDQVHVRGRRLIDIERDILRAALRHTGGNQRAAAELLDLPKSSLSDRLRRLGIATKRTITGEPASD